MKVSRHFVGPAAGANYLAPVKTADRFNAPPENPPMIEMKIHSADDQHWVAVRVGDQVRIDHDGAQFTIEVKGILK